MKVSFLPLGNENAASSRIRVFTLHKALVDSGITSFVGYNSEADVVFIQKKVDKEIFSLALKAKSEGKIIIYDVDDFGDALDYCCSPRYFKKIIKLVDIITTDNQQRLKYIVDKYNKNNVVILPNSVDYFPKKFLRNKPVNDDQLRIMWFGNVSNIKLFEKYAIDLLEISNAKIVVVTAVNEELEIKYPQIEFVPWSLSGFIDVLRGCHLTCLMHDGSDIDRAKSNNKMITSITWGVPAIVSNTPDYARTARESGVEYAVFDNVKELQVAIERLRYSEQRNEYLESAQIKVWEKYSPNIIANIFLCLVENYKENHEVRKPELLAIVRKMANRIVNKVRSLDRST